MIKRILFYNNREAWSAMVNKAYIGKPDFLLYHREKPAITIQQYVAGRLDPLINIFPWDEWFSHLEKHEAWLHIYRPELSDTQITQYANLPVALLADLFGIEAWRLAGTSSRPRKVKI